MLLFYSKRELCFFECRDGKDEGWLLYENAAAIFIDNILIVIGGMEEEEQKGGSYLYEQK